MRLFLSRKTSLILRDEKKAKKKKDKRTRDFNSLYGYFRIKARSKIPRAVRRWEKLFQLFRRTTGTTERATIYSSRILRCPRKQTDAYIDTSFVQYIKLRLTAKYIVLSHYYHCSTATLPSPPLPQSLPHRTTVATPATVLQCLIRGVPPAMQRHYSRGKSARKMTLILYRRSNEEKQRNQQTPEALYRHPASRLVSLRPRFTSPRLA